MAQNYTPIKKPLLQSSPPTKSANPEIKLWRNAAIISLIILLFIAAYQYLTRGRYSLYAFNGTIASTSMILIGLSFALSGICYFFNFADSYIKYRKHLGVAGFFYAALHAGISLVLYPKKTAALEFFLSEERRVPFLLGVSALLIFLMMALISNRYAITKLGGKLWRHLLHLGYLAYLLAIVHIILLNPDIRVLPVPPLFVLILCFALLVLLLRVLLFWKSRSAKQKATATPHK